MVKKCFYVLIGLTFLVCNSFSQGKDSSNMRTITFIEDIPIFNGDLKNFIQSHINYPIKAKLDSLEGTVIVFYYVDTMGITEGHEVLRGIRKDLDEEALRVTKLIKYEKPAMQHGKPIMVRYTVPVEFKLTEKSELRKKECKK
jgi:TonB family protein